MARTTVQNGFALALILGQLAARFRPNLLSTVEKAKRLQPVVDAVSDTFSEDIEARTSAQLRDGLMAASVMGGAFLGIAPPAVSLDHDMRYGQPAGVTEAPILD